MGKTFVSIVALLTAAAGGAWLEYKYQPVEKTKNKYQELKAQVQEEIEKRKAGKTDETAE